MKKVRVGIIGVGAQGRLYADFLTEGKVKNMVLGALSSRSPKKEAFCNQKYPNIPFYRDYIDMLDSGDVDAVITCTPHYTHPEIGIQALERNIHTLIEKPAGIGTKQVRSEEH